MNRGRPSGKANKPDHKAGGARAGAGRKKKACLVPDNMESDNSDQGESSRSQKKNKPQLLGIFSFIYCSPIFKGICQSGTHVSGKGSQQQLFSIFGILLLLMFLPSSPLNRYCRTTAKQENSSSRIR
jgi:hypothetical protein